jgi:tRNA(Ile)-lysidine synthase
VINTFKSFIRDKQLFSDDDKILLAVSGGMDSMAMAFLFHEAGYNFALIHCNFQLRGEESDLDEALVKKTAIRYGVNCYYRAFNTAEIAEKSGASIQMVARDLRYEYFMEVAKDNGFDYIATAHHLEDQTETFFINLLRGCGIAGLHGISIKKGNVIRPLMFAHRKEIETIVYTKNIPFREDASNNSLKYKRNKIRNQIIPLLREMNPAFDEEMVRNIHRLEETEEIFRQQIDLKRREVAESNGGQVYIDIDTLKTLRPLDTFLYEFVSEFGFNNDDVYNIVRALNGPPGKKFFSQSHQLVIDRKKIIISIIQDAEKADQEFFICENTSLVTDPIVLTFSIQDIIGYTIATDKKSASLDLGKLKFPLRLRHWKEGDYFFPLGMKNKKKLSDFFINEKYSLLQKQQTWILFSGEDIVWIIGERIDDRFKITEATQQVCKITLKDKY